MFYHTFSISHIFFLGGLVPVWGKHCGMLGWTLTLCWLANNSDPLSSERRISKGCEMILKGKSSWAVNFCLRILSSSTLGSVIMAIESSRELKQRKGLALGVSHLSGVTWVSKDNMASLSSSLFSFSLCSLWSLSLWAWFSLLTCSLATLSSGIYFFPADWSCPNASCWDRN